MNRTGTGSRRYRRGSAAAVAAAGPSDRGALIGLIVLLALVMLWGGSSRADVPYLIFVRPLAVLLLGYALWGLRLSHIRAHPWLFGTAMVILALPLLQLVPLPPSIWGALPGRALIAEIDAKAGLGSVWRPLSLVPSMTWNAFFALLVPLAALMFGLRLEQRDRARLVPLLLGFGFFSAVLGVLQIVGPPGGFLYFYPVTHTDSAVGLFANRNHEAAFLACMFPALALFATTPTLTALDGPLKPGLALAGGVILVPLILVTGSRAGLVAGMIGIALAGVILLGPLLKSRRDARAARLAAILGAAAVVGGICLVWVTSWLGRAEALQRLLGWEVDKDFRLQAWQSILSLARDYFPAGAGYGSFAEVYKAHEPRELLHGAYFNQAHNDWIEVLMTGGLPAAILLAVVCVVVLWRLVTLARRITSSEIDDRLALLGMSIILIMAFASTTDYPLRVPSIACIWVLAVVWAVPHGRTRPSPEAEDAAPFKSSAEPVLST